MQKFPYYLSCVQTDPTTPNDVGSCCVRLHGAKCLTGVKLCATTLTPNNTQQQICVRVYMRPFLLGFRLRANGRNNSQHCCANNVGSCCVRVASGMQTYVTTPNKFGTCSESWEEYNPKVFVIHA